VSPNLQYQAHTDAFDPKGDFFQDNVALGGNRLITVFAYLQSPVAGGHTAFPKLDLSFPPIQGDGMWAGGAL
jgi:prolyl 4-hydroxylase